MGDQLSWLEHLPYKQGVIGSSPISPTIAEIAQLVEQLTCNQQVTGSIPVFGTIFLEGQRSGQTRQTVNLFLRVPWFKSMSLHHLFWLFDIASQPSGKASHFDCDIRQFESSRGNHTNVPLAQPVEHLTFNQRVMRSNRIRDTIQKLDKLLLRGLFLFYYFTLLYKISMKLCRKVCVAYTIYISQIGDNKL